MCYPLKFLERRTQWVNLAELYIGLLKEMVCKDMKDSDSPLKLWDYYAKQRVLINNLTFKNLFQLDGANKNLKMVGDLGDISNLCSLGWFAMVILLGSKWIPLPGGKAWLLSWLFSQFFEWIGSVDFKRYNGHYCLSYLSIPNWRWVSWFESNQRKG